MIPANSTVILATVKNLPSKTFRFDIETKRIVGFIDKLEAVKQAAYFIFENERFENLIYSWNYGFEGNKLYGLPMELAVVELERYVTEALTQDDRITEIIDFVYTEDGNNLTAAFTVVSTEGSFEADVEVTV